MDNAKPLHMRTESFRVRAVESGMDNHVTLASLCNYLQEIAGNHAYELGVGIQALQAEGETWMLSRLKLDIRNAAKWRDEITVRTWPSGTSGRIIALRDFEAEDQAGNMILSGVSEWLYVDIKAMKIAKMPASISELAPVGTPRAVLPEMAPKFPGSIQPEWSSEITVRRSDQDFNAHVNNAHYVDWVLEPLPEAWESRYRVRTFDIRFRQAAYAGDILRSEVAREDGQTLVHQIVRPSDDSLLVQARSYWKEDD